MAAAPGRQKPAMGLDRKAPLAPKASCGARAIPADLLQNIPEGIFHLPGTDRCRHISIAESLSGLPTNLDPWVALGQMGLFGHPGCRDQDRVLAQRPKILDLRIARAMMVRARFMRSSRSAASMKS